jgi:tetratricopeptide (TPR) repeat protein
MAVASLRTAVSRWENGHVIPDAHYRRLFREIYGLTDAELGFAGGAATGASEATDGEQELRRQLASSTHIDAGLVALMQGQTDTIRRLDRRLGAPVLLEQMRAHTQTLRQLLRHAVLDSSRQPIAAALADAGALAGWQALDVGSVSEAWNHFEMAREAARISGEPALLAHAKGEQAYALLDLDQPTQALQLVREARTEAASSVPPRMLSWLWAAEAETAAAAGHESACRHALDRAVAVLPKGSARDPELPYVSLDEHHLARWRGSTLARLGDRKAVDQLNEALLDMDPEYTRARGALHIDLAQALMAADARDVAAVHIRIASDLAAETGSMRQRRRLLKLAA